ncbi:MAG: hypothetical protein V4498_06910 [candidate division FCPU426 bacterium]
MKILWLCMIVLTSGGAFASPDSLRPFPVADGRALRNGVCLADGVAYLAGEFKTVGGQSHNRVVAIDLNSGAVLPWDPDVKEGVVACVVAIGDKIYLGGTFKSVGGQPRRYLAAVYAAKGAGRNSGLIAEWNPGPDGLVDAMSVGPKGTLYIAGTFKHLGDLSRLRLAQVADADHGRGEATAFDPQPDARVNSVVWDGAFPGQVLATGFFSHCGGQERGLVALLSSASGAALDKQVVVDGTANKEVLRSIFYRGVYYSVGVEINTVNGSAHSNAFALDAASLTLKPWRADLSAGAGALSAQGENIYVGGDFLKANGQPRRVAAFDRQSGELSSWDPEPDNNTYALLAWPKGVVLSGYFHHLAGQDAPFLGELGLAGSKGVERESAIEEAGKQLLGGKTLLAYPNPARDRATAVFRVTKPGRGRLILADLSGRTVKTQDLGEMASGVKSVEMGIEEMASGVYLLALQIDPGFGPETVAKFKLAIRK